MTLSFLNHTNVINYIQGGYNDHKKGDLIKNSFYFLKMHSIMHNYSF